MAGHSSLEMGFSCTFYGFFNKWLLKKNIASILCCIFLIQNQLKIVLQGENYTEDLNTITLENGSFFKTSLEIQKLPCEYNCRGNIILTCLLGNNTYTIIDQEYLCIGKYNITKTFRETHLK